MILLLSFYIVFVCIVPIFLRLVSGKLNPLEPIVPGVAILISLFSIRPLAMLAAGDLDYYRWIYIADTIHGALFIVAIGVTAYVMGYYLIPLRTRRSRARYVDVIYRKSRLLFVCLLYAITGFVLAWVYVGSNPIGTLIVLSLGRSENFSDIITVHSEYLFAAPILIACAAILVIAVLGRKKLAIFTVMVVMVLILVPVAWFYMFGVRRFIIPSIFLPLLVFLLSRQAKPNLKHFVLILPIVMILAAIPFMRTEGARSQIGGFLDQAIYAFSRKDVVQEIFLGPDSEMLPAFAVEVQVLDSPGKFYYGAAIFGDLLIAPIPSALIAKPMSARNRMLVDTFGEPCSAVPGGLCPDFSVIGTFYQDFWLPGVILGMALMGYVGHKVWYVYVGDPENPFHTFNVAAVSVFTFIIFRAGFMPAFQWFLYFWIPVTLGLHIIVYRRFRRYAGAISVDLHGQTKDKRFTREVRRR